MPKRDQFLIKIGKSFNIFMIVDCRFENLYVDVDVDFGQIFIVDCRPMSKNIVESTERLTPPAPLPRSRPSSLVQALPPAALIVYNTHPVNS